jgi:chitinase
VPPVIDFSVVCPRSPDPGDPAISLPADDSSRHEPKRWGAPKTGRIPKAMVMINPRRCFVFLVILAAASSIMQAQPYRVVGYYPMWTRSALPVSAVRYASLTHINHAFAWPNPDGSISSSESNVDTALINATHRAGRKILLSFGGAGAVQTSNFAVVTADSVRMKIFINNVIARLSAYHYDGIDLDWEGPSSQAERANEVALVRRLREVFQASNSPWLITMAIGASNWSGQWHDYTSLVPLVDWFNAMEYDFHGSWSTLSGHNAPLYTGSTPTADPDYYSIDLSMQYLTGTRAIPKAKLHLGLAFYGKSFGSSSLYSSYAGETELTYRDILNTVQASNWTYVWDSGSQVPYYRSTAPPMIITLDDSASIALKCQYAKNKGLAGVMIWELSQDVIGQRQPLLDAVGTQMMSVTGIVAANSESLPAEFILYDNYPNPFNPETHFEFRISNSGFVSLKVYDVLGRDVTTLVNSMHEAGIHTAHWDASSMPSGVYFYRLQGAGFVATKKMLLIK